MCRECSPLSPSPPPQHSLPKALGIVVREYRKRRKKWRRRKKRRKRRRKLIS